MLVRLGISKAVNVESAATWIVYEALSSIGYQIFNALHKYDEFMMANPKLKWQTSGNTNRQSELPSATYVVAEPSNIANIQYDCRQGQTNTRPPTLLESPVHAFMLTNQKSKQTTFGNKIHKSKSPSANYHREAEPNNIANIQYDRRRRQFHAVQPTFLASPGHKISILNSNQPVFNLSGTTSNTEIIHSTGSLFASIQK